MRENGDTMNDAIYARNAKVEEQLGININVISRNGEYGQHTQFNSDVVKEVMSGDTEYDVISYYAYAMPMIARQNVPLQPERPRQPRPHKAVVAPEIH